MKLISKLKKHFFAFEVSIFFIFLLTYFFIGCVNDLIAKIFPDYKNDIIISGIVSNIIFVILIILIMKIADIKMYKFNYMKFLKGVFIYALPFILFITYFLILSLNYMFKLQKHLVSLDAKTFLISNLILAFTIGLNEELFFRGLILNSYKNPTKKQLAFLIIYSSLFFGAAHLTGLFWSNQTNLYIIHQSLFNIFAVIYIKTKQIWLVILLHALWDYIFFCTKYINRYNFRGLIIPNFMKHQLIIVFISFIWCLMILLIDILIKSKKNKEKQKV